MVHYTPFVSETDVNPLELNERFTEISDKIDDVLGGAEALTTPTINSFVNAAHDHEDAAGGGQLTVAAISSGAATDGQVATADGAGNVAWESPVVTEEFLDLTDTPNSYSGLGGALLRVNNGETAVEAVTPNIYHYELDEGADYTTTSTTLVDVDATNLSFNVTVQPGSRGIEVSFICAVSNTGVANASFLEVTVDGTPIGGDHGLSVINANVANYRTTMGFVRYHPLAAGTYTVRLQWRVSAGTSTLYAGAGTVNGDIHPQFLVKEVL